MPFKCPICKKPADESTIGKPKSVFPFCSDRCKLIDLGRWLDGAYQIPVKDADAEESADETTLEAWQKAEGGRRRAEDD